MWKVPWKKQWALNCVLGESVVNHEGFIYRCWHLKFMDIGTVFCGLTNNMLDISLPTFVPKLMWRIVIINLYFCELKRRSNWFTLLFWKEDFFVLFCSIHGYIYPRDMGIVPSPSMFKVLFFKQMILINLLNQKGVLMVYVSFCCLLPMHLYHPVIFPS